MRAALVEFNQMLQSEGRPALAFGIGINTAHVVAGNIGSHRRLNYSVIGDGVNIAARLQTLTRNPAHGADIIISAATLTGARSAWPTRALGAIAVKGRVEAVEVFALG
jgi:adenylate cyclase